MSFSFKWLLGVKVNRKTFVVSLEYKEKEDLNLSFNKFCKEYNKIYNAENVISNCLN